MKDKFIEDIQNKIEFDGNYNNIKKDININKYCEKLKKSSSLNKYFSIKEKRIIKTVFAALIIILLALVPIIIFSNSGEDPTPSNGSNFPTKQLNKVNKPVNKYLNETFNVDENYKNALNNFTVDFAKKIINDESQIFSPISIYNCFAMVYEGSTNNNKKELEEVFYIDGSFDLAKSVQGAMDYLLINTKDTILKTANSIWIDDQFANDIKSDYLNVLATNYYAEMFEAALESTKNHQLIADWINKETNNLLNVQKEAFQGFDENTILALVNSIYLKATWIESFQKNLDVIEDFTLNNGNNISQEYMVGTLSGLVIKGESYDIISIPMKDNMRMNILFPKDNTNNIEIFNNNLNELLDLNTGLSNTSIYCKMPKFTIEKKYDLVEITNKLGLNNIFTFTKDFSNMVSDKYDVAVSSASHAAKIIVNNSGIEAAAYTVIGMDEESVAPEPYVLKLTRPFMYSVCMDDIPLFVGTYFGN